MNLPRFSFHLYVLGENGKTEVLPTIHAEAFDIKDGAIVFYQVMNIENKKINIPVLAYPAGSWLRCGLVEEHEYVVFDKGVAPSVPAGGGQNVKNVYPLQTHHRRENPLAPAPTFAQNNQAKNEEWANYLINFHKQHATNFDIYAFKDFLNKSNIRYSEADWQWAAVKLIKNSTISPRYFTDTHAQKLLDIHAKKTITSHWDGKINPILQILNEREETKNITQVDLAVWLANNGLFK